MGIKARNYSGSTDGRETVREQKNRELSRRAATEGVVLLKNEGLLPLATDKKLAVYGNGIAKIIKGGTGSGDVNERRVVSVLDGLLAAGYPIVNEENARKYIADHKESMEDWREKVLAEIEKLESSSDMSFFGILADTKGKEYDDIPILEEQLEEADAVIYIISRVAGEGKDRNATEGDYYLTAKEKQQLQEIAGYHKNIVLLVNTGAQIDITDLHVREAIKSIVYISQPGMEAGHVIADILSGKVNPSGHLTTTWSRKYEDFPNAATFSHCNGDTTNEYYEEGIYIGYRYFDSFGVDTLYPFGYGLSYTGFDLKPEGVFVDENVVKVRVTVTNTGAVYAGKQVVQVYAACPQNETGKELKRLIGFQKTGLLAPGQSETVEIAADAKCFASYDAKKAVWVVEQGEYAVFAGENAADIKLAGVLDVEVDSIIEKVPHILPLQTELHEIRPDGRVIDLFTENWKKEAEEAGILAITYSPTEQPLVRLPETEHAAAARKIAESMEDDELVAMLMGEITKGQDNIVENELVQTGIYVPGAAGETSCRFAEKYGVPAISMADGPAGLRVMRKYDVDNKTGLIYGHGLLSALEGGFLSKEYDREDVTTYYMYATAIPIGTMLAQTWNLSILKEIGTMVAGEMQELGISWWLAPGMNIHRNPLCGRNFEYYSEDPLVAGTMAAAITQGVQSVPGVGTTIKHFACNNQEDNRLHSNSIVSERALRELYLRGFEIAVKTSQPMCVMSSYNLINGIPTSNSVELLTEVLRNEWDFKGIVMTDWTTTTAGSAVPYKCAEAGNDLIMPGNKVDVDDITEALKSGALDRAKVTDCAARLIAVIFDTLGMEEPKPYGRIRG